MIPESPQTEPPLTGRVPDMSFFGPFPFGERLATYIEELRGHTRLIVELAASEPNGPLDFPDNPVDPALHEAAKRLATELGLEEQVAAFSQTALDSLSTGT